MSKLLFLLVCVPLASCAATSTRNSVGPADASAGVPAGCGDCSPCDANCPPDCDTCTVVCSGPACGECVVTLRRDGDSCRVVSCEPLAPGEPAPANARRVDCSAACGTSCRD